MELVNIPAPPENLVPFSKLSDAEKEKIMAYKETINSNEYINNLLWKKYLERLLHYEMITPEKYREQYIKHLQTSKKGEKTLDRKMKALESAVNAITCNKCGEVVNAGTYALIFQNKEKPSEVIKGAIKAHTVAFGCPAEYVHEITMIDKIKAVFPKGISIKMLEKTESWVENRRCYYSMQKINPIHLTDEIKEIISQKIMELEEEDELNNKDTIRILDALITNPELYMLVPGIKEEGNRIHFDIGGNKYSNWRELGQTTMALYFNLLGIDIERYYRDLKSILQSTLENKILIRDVEFILGSIELPDGSLQNGIFMIDFDKTKKIESIKEIENLLREDMFPEDFLSRFKEFVSMGGYKKTKKRHNKHKKDNKHNKHNKHKNTKKYSRRTYKRV